MRVSSPTALVFLVVAIASLLDSARAEFSPGGTSKFAACTRQASVEVNVALATYHNLMATADSGILDEVVGLKDQVVDQLRHVESVYNECTSHGSGRILAPVDFTSFERERVSYLRTAGAERGIQPPFTERYLAMQAARLTAEFADEVSEVDPEALLSNVSAQQRIEHIKLEYEALLLAMAMVLHRG
jgi:hypothetical protein